jgi:hypothetical protein
LAATDEAELQAAYSSITLSTPVQPRPAPAAAPKTSRGAISLIKAADSRILALEAEGRRRDAELDAVLEQLQQAKVGGCKPDAHPAAAGGCDTSGARLPCSSQQHSSRPTLQAQQIVLRCLAHADQDAVTRRDGEIQRLSVQLERGPDVDELAQRCRTEANEAVILHLNQQASMGHG